MWRWSSWSNAEAMSRARRAKADYSLRESIIVKPPNIEFFQICHSKGDKTVSAPPACYCFALGTGDVTVIRVESTSSTLIQRDAVWVCYSAVLPASVIFGRRYPKPTFFTKDCVLFQLLVLWAFNILPPPPPLTMNSSVILVRRIKNVNVSKVSYLPLFWAADWKL